MSVQAADAAGASEASAAGKFGWAMFDWANQPFFTIITTFIFAPYFTATVVGDAVRGQALWGYTQAAAGITIALLAPFLGAIADAGGRRKPWILVFSALCMVGCFALWWAVPGAAPGTLGFILVVVVLATIGVEFAGVFNNAMLPDLVPEGRMGRLSGFAWGLGYIGGLVSLFIVLLGFSFPEQPLLGLDRLTHEHDRIVGPLSAVWLLIFIIPLFVWTPDRAASGLAAVDAARRGIATLLGTLRALPRFRNIALYLVARMFYYDGQAAIFAFGGIYAAGLFDWGTTQLGVFGIIILVFAALGCFVGGWLDDRLGSKKTIILAVVGLVISALGVVSIGGGKALFVFDVGMPQPGGALFDSTAERFFLVISVLLGIFGGPAQAASRTMLARLAPPEMSGEFFGLYALSGKATAFLAPLTIGVVTDLFQSQRIGIAMVLPFLLLGLFLFIGVKEERAPATEP